jgi:hypothetical protein
MADKKRRHARKGYNDDVVLWFEKQAYVVTIENITLSGALISKQGIPQIELDDEVIITIPYKKKDKTVELKGRVKSLVGDGAGVEFLK